MGANNHSTTRPSNVGMDTKRKRLMNDLKSLEVVTSVRAEAVARNGVVFETADGDLTASVCRVLAENGAFVPAEQPHDKRSHSTLIHTS